MTFLPSVIRAEHRGGYRIHVTFNDNTEKTIDFLPWLEGPVFEPLKDLDYFSRFFLDGGTVVWPNGADVAPETLYEYREPADKRSARSQQGKARAPASQRKVVISKRGAAERRWAVQIKLQSVLPPRKAPGFQLPRCPARRQSDGRDRL